jgi:hypothetical protein
MRALGLALYALSLVGAAAARADENPMLGAARMYAGEGNREKALTLYEAYVAQNPTAPQAAAARVEIERLEADRPSSEPPPSAPVFYGPAEAPEMQAPASTTRATVRPTVRAREPERPLYKKGWFWATLVGVTLVVAGGVTLAVVLTSSDSASASTGTGPSTTGLQIRF